MTTYNKYPITVNLIPGLPTVAFETADHKAAGVVMHATANYSNGNDTADGERAYETHNFKAAFVHTFTDFAEILQVAPFNNGAYHAYTYANHHYLGNELCQFTDAAKFAASYDRWVWLAARQLFDLKLAPKDKSTLWSHKEISETYSGNHEDPIAYLASHGKTWANVLTDVTNYYNAMVEESKPKPVAPVVKPAAPTAPAIKAVGTIKIVGVSAAAIICDKPSATTSKNLGTIALGKTISISGSVPGWWEVIFNGQRAYINDKFGEKI